MHDTITLGSRMVRFAAIAGSAALVGACTWVKLTPPGESVRVGTASQVTACQRVGSTHSKTWTGIFGRSQKKIDQELESLARNEAADMGGDTIVPQGPTSSEGRRSFDVFHCAGS